MVNFKSYLCFSCIIHFLTWNVEAAAGREGANRAAAQTYSSVHIGAVLDLNSTMGAMTDLSLSMARSDFYSVHSDYRTRLFLHIKDAKDELDVASEVLELLSNEEVHGILGPQKLTEDTFIPELGRKVQVPIISFTTTRQVVSHTQNPYFLRTTPDNSNQVKALASICKGFEWHEVVILYEDTDYGYQLFSELNKAFEEVQIQLSRIISFPTSAKDHEIKKELERLMTMQTRVFLVHMNPALGQRLFLLAKRAGMMSEGYAWLITDSLGNFLQSMDSTAIESMEGVLGIRPYVPRSKNLENFKERWKKNMILQMPENTLKELNVYGLWAYDTVWALAMALEKIGPVSSSFLKVNNRENGSDIFNLRISQFGPKMLSELHNISFEGLSGEFRLIDGKLKPSALEIFNVIGTDRIVGYWRPDGGITRKLASTGGQTYSTSKMELKSILWPGDTVTKPKGWAIPAVGKLKVGVPKKIGFTEFVNVSVDPLTNQINVTGFSIDIFLCALQQLPFKVDHEFIPFMNASGLPNGTYNELLHHINEPFDIVVGDITILSDRAEYTDFTLPYSESGVIMVVKNKQDKDMWIFIKPFRWDLWLTILSTCIFIGIVLRVLEHRANSNSGSARPHRQQLGLLFWFPIAVLAFPERNMVANNWSRFVLVVWLFMSYIMMQSYTANLSAMFTVNQLDFRFSEDYNIGYQEGSFVKEFLVNHLHFSESKLKEYSTVEQIHDAFTKGSKNGGIDAFYDEIPYLKLFLNRYDSQYKMYGQSYRTDGFGFAFPLDSPLVVHFSRAILKVIAADMTGIEQKNFGPRYSSELEGDSITEQSPSLTAYNFGGLFIIIGSALVFAVCCSETSVRRKFIAMVTYCSHKCFSFLSPRDNDLRTNSTVYPDLSKDSLNERKIQLSEQSNSNNSSRESIEHQSGESYSNVSAEHGEVDESDPSNNNAEIQQSEPGNSDFPNR